ncbi:hypothetical protein ABEB36_004867 [Hypothenemus hampei]|uniref:Uncharacterized protein n=1 Tax=Hypothenemus hampei TaxID=57062 RepID=A0ABD1EW47_HYPHA
MKIYWFLCLLFTFYVHNSLTEIVVKKIGDDIDFYYNETTNGLNLTVIKNEKVKLTATLGVGLNFTNLTSENITLFLITTENTLFVLWSAINKDFEVMDCINLEKGNLSWYGGPEIYQQEWPIEKLQLNGSDPYVVRKNLNFAVPERYWLNSNGAFIFVDERAPLFVDQNLREDDKLCFIAKNSDPYINRSAFTFTYNISALDNLVDAHKYALKTFLNQPKKLPNEKMIQEPIWTTWAKYKKNINDTVVREFAYDILNHGFNGQIEIDEQWETCFGSRKFIPEKFGNISNVIADLKAKKLRVTIWAAPFINSDCTDLIKEGEENGYFVKNTAGDMTTVWWEGSDSRQIDFTNKAAREWYSQKLRNFTTDPGVDGFKFDAGETDYVAQPAVYENEEPELVPNILTQRYIETISEFGDLIEARSAFQTQQYNLFLRMIDKDSVWGLDDGLQSLVTTLLQLNMVGYSYVLPDMIGGNGYRQQPTLELLIRWTQATVFMPSMQFSYLPWDFPNDDQLNGTAIIKSMVDLHSKFAPTIIEAMKATLQKQIPTNAPIWWIAPDDEIALRTSDEFLLGDTILVAPVMEEGATSRMVYLPKGTWIDGNNETVNYSGPISLNYSAPLSVLPYFIKQID